MNTEVIASLGTGEMIKSRYSILNHRGREYSINQDGITRLTPVKTDDISLSQMAMTSYKSADEGDEFIKNLEDKFLEALKDFTSYAMKLNGIKGTPTGKDGWNVLNILAQKSGIEMPMDINEGKYKLMAQFQEKWGLSGDPSVEEIYDKMKRVFGDDKSWHDPSRGWEDMAGLADGGKMGSAGSADHTGSLTLEDKFLEALKAFTEYAYELNGKDGEITGQEGLNVLTILAEKSGVRMPENINEGKDKLLSDLKSAWGLGPDATVSQIYQKMMRVFGNDTTFTQRPNDETTPSLASKMLAGVYSTIHNIG